MYKYFRPNSLIDETREVCRKSSYFKVSVLFLLVYMIGNFLTSMVMTGPLMTYVMGDAEINEIMGSNLPLDEYEHRINEALARIYANMPEWMNALTLYASVAVIAVVIFYCTRIEKRRLFTLGLRLKGAVLEYISGMGIGLLLFTAVYGIDLLSGELVFGGINQNLSVSSLVLFFFGFVIQGASEEILLRGSYFVSSAACGSVPIAALLSSGLFAAMHLGNNGVSVIAILNIFLFGIFATLYFLRRGSVWGICAIHSVWNFAQGNIFGCRVSGMQFGSSLFTTVENGGAWSGGAFGPEGGLGATVILGIAIFVMLFIKNKNIEGFYLRKAPDSKVSFY